MGGALWICPQVALGCYFNSTGKPVEPAKLDFWKEGEGKSGKSILSSQPAVPGTIPFTGPWVRALLISVTGIQENMCSPSLCHPLDTGYSPRSQVAHSLWGRQQTHADKAKARQLIRAVNKATEEEGAAGQQREPWGLASYIEIQALNIPVRLQPSY